MLQGYRAVYPYRQESRLVSNGRLVSNTHLSRMRDITTVQHQRRRLRLVHHRLGERQHGPHVLELLEVERHVRGQHHVDDQRAELAELVPGQVLEDVALLVAEQPAEKGGGGLLGVVGKLCTLFIKGL